LTNPQDTPRSLPERPNLRYLKNQPRISLETVMPNRSPMRSSKSRVFMDFQVGRS
jgi:hypothetical protein